MNNRIRVPEVRVIDESGKQLGVLATHIALNVAREKGLDLVEISPNAVPPVCKIIDYGKYRYEQKKKESEARKKQVKITVKEIKLGIGIQEHDLNIKVNYIRNFLENGERVKVIVWFRGREVDRPGLGEVVLKKVIEKIADVGVVDQSPRLFGRSMNMFVVPQVKKK